MATGSLILGKLSGSIGDVTAQSRGSKQVARRRVREVSNPKTNAQTLNRIITGTVGAAYSRLKEICDHSFQGLASKSSNMEQFLALNQNMLRTAVIAGGSSLGAGNFLAVGKTGLIPNPYIVSKGTLPSVQFLYKVSAGSASPVIEVPTSISDSPTYSQLCDWYGLQRGDQLTFVWIEGGDFPTVADDEALYGINNLFFYSRVILDPVDPATALPSPMSTAFFDESGLVNHPSPRNSGISLRFSVPSTSAMQFYPYNNTLFEDRPCFAFGVIVSRQNNGVWMRSTCKMLVHPSIINTPSMAKAIEDSYPDASDLLDPAKFLNASPKN